MSGGIVGQLSISTISFLTCLEKNPMILRKALLRGCLRFLFFSFSQESSEFPVA